jgi:hypothetical protein
MRIDEGPSVFRKALNSPPVVAYSPCVSILVLIPRRQDGGCQIDNRRSPGQHSDYAADDRNTNDYLALDLHFIFPSSFG